MLADNWCKKSINEYQDEIFRMEPYIILYSIHFTKYFDNKEELEKIIKNINVVIGAKAEPKHSTMFIDQNAEHYLNELKNQVIERIGQL